MSNKQKTAMQKVIENYIHRDLTEQRNGRTYFKIKTQ